MLVLSSHFLFQLEPDIFFLKKGKLKRLDDGPQIPHRDLPNTAFKVFNEKEEQERIEMVPLTEASFWQ